MNEPQTRHRLYQLLIGVIIANALATAWLVKTVLDQNHRIHTLERHDKIQQSVDTLNSKYESLKSRVEGLFR
jgi:hypothetical protein